jgi:hypothetical protein
MAAPRRASRRPGRWLLAAVLVTLAVLVTNAAVRSRPNTAETLLAYLDQIRPDVQRSAGEGADLADVRANAVQLGRDGISRRLDRLVSDAKTTLTSVTNLTPPASLRVAHAYLLTTLAVRARAAEDARTAMAAALAEGPADPVVQGLVSVGQDISLGDRSYQLFAASFQAAPAVPLPASMWVTDSNAWSQPELTAFVTSLRSSTSLTPVHDLAVVTFTTDPPPVGIDAGAEVIPPTKGLQVAIVVADVGNLAERHATVTATLHTNGANTTQSVRDFVDLTPGQRVALQLGSLRPVSGTTGTLTVAISPAAGETALANNTQGWTVELR